MIDTNSWIELYLETAEEKNLEQLLKWEKDGKIKFLLPETLNQELVRQKGIQLNLLKKKIKNLSNTTSKETLSKLKEEFRLTEIKIAKIESVLLGAIKIKITNKLHKIIGIKYTTGQPPFHKQNSHNDAYIYFSSVEYIQKKKIGSFVFISKNVTDFGAPENPNLNIHPGLLVPDIEVQYFSAVALAVNKLQKDLGSDAGNDNNSTADYTEIFHFFSNEKELAIQDHVYMALTKYHEQLPFIPPHLLARIFPFKTENFRHPEAYHSAFQLNSNNEKLMEFFNSFSITKSNSIHLKSGKYKGKEKKVKETLKQIVKLLRTNLIYTIEGIGNSLHADIQTLHEENCNCIRCTYNRFDIYNAFLLLDNTIQENIAETLKQAYMHYQFQQFDEALKLFFTVYSSIKDKDQPMLMFICLTNLKRLSRIITNYGNSANPEAMQIIKDMNKISLRKTRLSIPTTNPFVNEVIDWIADDNFHSQALENITHTVEKIADHYNIQLRGGYSTNSNFDNLISQFAELDVFLESNFLVYNNFQEFEKVVDKLMEGLFMIYSFNKKQSTRIAFINDYLMSRIIM
ncbi:MAG: PIN domain-containing protein, partial [Ferruginibacter sp.]